MKRLALAAGLLALSACASAPEPAPAPPTPTLASLGHQGLDPASGGAPQQLVVFFHGYTQRGEAMRPLATALAARLPDAAFVFNNAPIPANNGFSWYNFRGDDSVATKTAASEAASGLVVSLSNTYGVPASRIVTVGFSQGGGVAVQAATCVTPQAAAVVSLAGVIEVACSRGGGAPPDTLIVWNDGDPTVGRDRIDAGIKTLDGAGYKSTLKVVQGAGHWPVADGLKAAEDFIVAELGG